MVKFVNLAEIDNSIQQSNMNDLRIQDALYGQQRNRMEMDKMRRADQDNERIRGFTREAGGDLNTLRNRLYQEGYLDQGSALDKQIADQRKSGADLQGTELGNAKKKIDILGSVWGAIRNAPEQAENILTTAIQSGIIPEQEGRVLLERMPQDMEERRKGAEAIFTSTIDAAKQLETFSTVNAGGRQVTQGVNPVTGAVREVGSMDVTMTPYQIEQNKISKGQLDVSRGNLNLSRQKFNEEKAGGGSGGKAPAGYRFKQDGSLEAIPGGPADKGSDNLKLTEQQGKSNLFYTRATQADNILNDPKLKYNPLAINAKNAVGKTPLLGGGAEATANLLLSEGSQKAEQAQRDFVNAVLRLESGAVINPEEFDNAKKQYFPQPGDGPQVIKQKAQNRKTAIQGLKTMAGPAVKDTNKILPNDARIDDVMSEADRILGL